MSPRVKKGQEAKRPQIDLLSELSDISDSRKRVYRSCVGYPLPAGFLAGVTRAECANSLCHRVSVQLTLLQRRRRHRKGQATTAEKTHFRGLGRVCVCVCVCAWGGGGGGARGRGERRQKKTEVSLSEGRQKKKASGHYASSARVASV